MKAINKQKTWILLATVFSLALGTTGVQAQTIGVNFPGNTSSTLSSTDSAGVVLATNWNNATLGTSGTTTNLIDSTGAATGVTFSFAGAKGGWHLPTAASTPDQVLMHGYADTAAWSGAGLTGGVENTPLTLHLSGIAYASYKVYVYYASDTDNRTGWISSGTVTFNTSTGQFASTTGTAYGVRTDLADSESGTFVQATNTTILSNTDVTTLGSTTYSKGNYVLFENQSGDTFDITLGIQGNAFGVTGIQVVAVPEPSTWALLGFGLVTVTAVTLRRRQSVVG